MNSNEFWKGKTILVTGGTGFLGRHLTDKLNSLGAKEVVSLGSKDMDLTSPTDSVKWASEHAGMFDLIFHLAVWAKPGNFGLEHPAELISINSMINLNLLRIWHEFFPKARLVAMGSICEYPGSMVNMSEDEIWNGEPHESVRAYATTKRLLYEGQRSYARQYDLDTLHVVLTTSYGPGDHFEPGSSHVVGALIDRFVRAKEENIKSVVVWGDGYQTRECMFVDDQIEGILLVAQHSKDTLINIGPGKAYTIREIAENIAKICEYKGEIIYDTTKFVGARHKLLNIDRAKSAINWSSQTSLEDGLRKTTMWYRKNVLRRESVLAGQD